MTLKFKLGRPPSPEELLTKLGEAVALGNLDEPSVIFLCERTKTDPLNQLLLMGAMGWRAGIQHGWIVRASKELRIAEPDGDYIVDRLIAGLGREIVMKPLQTVCDAQSAAPNYPSI